MQKTWNVKKTDIALQKKLSQELGISTLLAQLLINRDVSSPDSARAFLRCALIDLHDAFLMKGVKEAVIRIEEAVEKKEKIVVWGDYDVDGLTSVALLKRVLAAKGANVSHYIPHRVQDGYGMSLQAAEKISEAKAELVITVDCGINSRKEVEFLKFHNIDVIITDHHQPPADGLPAARAVINPLQKECPYPFKYLAGVGVVFKLCQALTGSDLYEHLDLVALGTISDVVPMYGENRILTKHGLIALSNTTKTGLLRLMEKSGIKDKELTTMHAAFMLGPRLNASGRMGSCENSLEILMTDFDKEAVLLAQKLCDDNRARQQLEAKILSEALAKIDKEVNFKKHRVIILHSDNWHPGVIGIVASRITERFFRPTILFSSKEGRMAKGSGRSIDNFHLFQALSSCSEFLSEFGGHKKACGLSMKLDDIDNFRDAINAYAQDSVSPEAFIPDIKIDAEIPLSFLNEEFIKQIENLGPFGQGNPKPVFVSTGISIKSAPRIVGKNTLKMWVSDANITCSAVGFKMADMFTPGWEHGLVDIVYTPALNQWHGTSSIELYLKDLRERKIDMAVCFKK